MTERAPQQIDPDEPLDPAVEKVRAKLMRFVVINLGILFLALMAVVGALVYRAVSTEASTEEALAGLPLPPEGSTITGQIALPAGASVLSQSLAGGRLTLLIETAGAREIVVYDIGSARIIARFALVDD
ncbi:fimbrial protein [Mesorhizobium sp. YIM 152430]|uniref:fimbrial protein n=1 Tax=Mesorhizobium sp. YIM 152430 TaxID=3031761 RepID=UPI0023DC00D0|nr:fimbrial protein [Mesorhizobium sp. YIM 152430]MDF1599267.1 fimbrial protein [Mesorhizobium sp. YIM 152430]